MILGIDASNIRAGGGVTHLVELLRSADPAAHGFSKVIVWSGRKTLDRIDEHDWLVKSHQHALDRAMPHRVVWQRFRLASLAYAAGCDLLFVPGGTFAGGFQPVTTLSQNLLPFEWHEAKRYGWSWMAVRMRLLRAAQSRTFRKADGVIFLTRYARDVVLREVGRESSNTTIVPHGIDPRFMHVPREQEDIRGYSLGRPFRLLYVSIVDLYKHQWHVAEAVAQLRAEGLPVTLELVGPAYGPALDRLQETLAKIDPSGQFIRYSGPVSYDDLHNTYSSADLCIFASSCENLPIILLEGMASGLPIACSHRGPMPEVLGDAGVYFDPERPDDIARALRELVGSRELRARMTSASHRRAADYSWRRCAGETFDFLAATASARGKK